MGVIFIQCVVPRYITRSTGAFLSSWRSERGSAVIEIMKLRCHRQREGSTLRFAFLNNVCPKQVRAWNQAVPSSPLIKWGHQRRLTCWRPTQSVLIAIRKERKTFIHLIWNVQTLVETWDAFSIEARAREHMERCKLSDPPDLACVGVVFALTPILNCFSKRVGFSVCFCLFSLGLENTVLCKWVSQIIPFFFPFLL